MIIYILIFMYCTLMSIFNESIRLEREKKLLVLSTLIMLCIISGTRYYLGGTDYYVYEYVFNSVPKLNEFIINYRNLDNLYLTFGFEKGYLCFNSLVKTLGFNFFGFTLIHSIIFYSCLYKGLKKYISNFNFLIIVFLYKIFFYNTFISMRQSITIAIFFVAISYMEDNKKVKYFIAILIATYFHKAAFILFIVYFINKVKLTKKLIIKLNIIFIPTMIFSLLHIPILRVFNFFIDKIPNPTTVYKVNSLINEGQVSSIAIFHTLEYFILMILVIINFEKIKSIGKHTEIILKLFLILLPVFTLFRDYGILTRIKDYFTFTYAIILGYLCLIDNSKYKNIVHIMTLLVCAYGFFRFIILFDGGDMKFYQSYILKGISIFSR